MSFGTEEDKKLRCQKNLTLSWVVSLQSRHNFGEQVLNNFLWKLWLPSLISMAVEGWGEKEICIKGAVDSQGGGGGGGGGV